MTDTETTQVYRVFIRATPEQIWDALTQPEQTVRYFYGARIHVTADRYEGLGPDGSDWGSGATLEFDAPRRLVHEWRSNYDPELAAEPASRVTFEIEPTADGQCMLTLTHDRLERSPQTAANVGGGWSYVLDSLKTMLETGEPLPRAGD